MNKKVRLALLKRRARAKGIGMLSHHVAHAPMRGNDTRTPKYIKPPAGTPSHIPFGTLDVGAVKKWVETGDSTRTNGPTLSCKRPHGPSVMSKIADRFEKARLRGLDLFDAQ